LPLQRLTPFANERLLTDDIKVLVSGLNIKVESLFGGGGTAISESDSESLPSSPSESACSSMDPSPAEGSI
jgi:hypothetical protein